MESQPQIPEFRNNPENFHPCITVKIGPECFNSWLLFGLITGLDKHTFSALNCKYVLTHNF